MKYIITTIIFLIPLTASAEDLCQWNHGEKAELDYCESADTCFFENITGSVTFIDLNAFDKSKCKQKAKMSRKKLVQKLRSQKYVCVKIVGKDRIGNKLGEFYVDGQNVSHWMLRNGYAKKYGQNRCHVEVEGK